MNEQMKREAIMAGCQGAQVSSGAMDKLAAVLLNEIPKETPTYKRLLNEIEKTFCDSMLEEAVKAEPVSPNLGMRMRTA